MSRVVSATLLSYTTCSRASASPAGDGAGVGAPWPLPGPSSRVACPGTLPLANVTSVLAPCMCCGQVCGRASSHGWLFLDAPLAPQMTHVQNGTLPRLPSQEWTLRPVSPAGNPHSHTPFSLSSPTSQPLPGTSSLRTLFPSLTFVLGFEVVSHGSL